MVNWSKKCRLRAELWLGAGRFRQAAVGQGQGVGVGGHGAVEVVGVGGGWSWRWFAGLACSRLGRVRRNRLPAFRAHR